MIGYEEIELVNGTRILLFNPRIYKSEYKDMQWLPIISSLLISSGIAIAVKAQ